MTEPEAKAVSKLPKPRSPSLGCLRQVLLAHTPGKHSGENLDAELAEI